MLFVKPTDQSLMISKSVLVDHPAEIRACVVLRGAR